ncbi:MAG: hypothetical protein WCH01_01935 [Methylococcaceae bacterium]
MYIHEVVLREDDPTTAFKTAAEVPEGSKLHSANRGAIFSFIQNLRDVKSSKVVDENGEPLVFYHGNNNDITYTQSIIKECKACKRSILYFTHSTPP